VKKKEKELSSSGRVDVVNKTKKTGPGSYKLIRKNRYLDPQLKKMAEKERKNDDDDVSVCDCVYLEGFRFVQAVMARIVFLLHPSLHLTIHLSLYLNLHLPI
tara:strand:+ start:268 stop:573 length:306 start_codon:yes stop_codon:yes gene_type:complete